MPYYLKPKSPLQNTENYIYPLTTSDQIVVEDKEDKRLTDYSILTDNEINIILSASKWVKVNGRYKQSITIKDLTEDYSVGAKLAYTGVHKTDLLIAENAAYIKYAKQDDNRISFYCLKNKPNVDIHIELEVTV